MVTTPGELAASNPNYPYITPREDDILPPSAPGIPNDNHLENIPQDATGYSPVDGNEGGHMGGGYTEPLVWNGQDA